MSTPETNVDVHAYMAAVRIELEDLEPAERDDLLDDLEQHLHEVAAEEEGTLTDRLGPPAAYAAELRLSAGLPPTPAQPPADPGRAPGRPGEPRPLAELPGPTAKRRHFVPGGGTKWRRLTLGAAQPLL